jgi:hypothetical protein
LQRPYSQPERGIQIELAVGVPKLLKKKSKQMNATPSDESGKSCPLCTYGNKINATVCRMCETRLEVVVKHEGRLKAEANEESPPKPKRESSPKREAFNLMDLCATPILQVVVKHERLKAEAIRSPRQNQKEKVPRREKLLI